MKKESVALIRLLDALKQHSTWFCRSDTLTFLRVRFNVGSVKELKLSQYENVISALKAEVTEKNGPWNETP